MNQRYMKYRRQQSQPQPVSEKPKLSYQQMLKIASKRGLFKIGMTKKDLEAIL